MTGMLRRLMTDPCEALITKGRVRMRRLACAKCKRQTWVIVGPPRCTDCASGAPPRQDADSNQGC